MHSVLFVASIPQKPVNHTHPKMIWGAYLGLLEPKIRDAENIARLAENVWLVDVSKGFGPLGHLVSVSENQSISYGLLPFEKAPE